MSHEVFISYSSKDIDVANGILNYLENNGIQCWMAPRDIMAGAHYASSILVGIKTSKVFVLVFSSNSDSSEQVLKEVDRAVNARLAIIPFRIENVVPSEAMEYYLCNTHWLNATGGIVEKYFDDLRRSCEKFLNFKGPILHRPTQHDYDKTSDRLKLIIDALHQESVEEEKKNRNSHQQPDVSKEDEFDDEISFHIMPGPEKNNLGVKVDNPAPKEQTEAENKDKRGFPVGAVALGILLIIGFIKVIPTAFKQKKTEIRQVEQNFDKAENVKDKKLRKKVEKKLEVKTPAQNSLRPRQIISYKKLSGDYVNELQLDSYGIQDLEMMIGSIKSKDGGLFERVGHELVEKKNNKFEVNNLVLLKNQINKLVALKMNLNINNYKVIFNPTEEGSVDTLENLWLLSSSLQKTLIEKHKTYVPLRKSSPKEKDFKLADQNNTVISFQIFQQDDKALNIECSNRQLIAKINKSFAQDAHQQLNVKHNPSLKYKNEIVFNFSNVDQPQKLFESLQTLIYQLNSI